MIFQKILAKAAIGALKQEKGIMGEICLYMDKYMLRYIEEVTACQILTQESETNTMRCLRKLYKKKYGSKYGDLLYRLN